MTQYDAIYPASVSRHFGNGCICLFKGCDTYIVVIEYHIELKC
jgi:hypothetical protein